MIGFFFFLFFFFFSKQIYFWGPYSVEKKPFHLMIRLFFFFIFSNKLVFGALFHWKKLFQIMISLFFLFFSFFFFFFRTNLSLGALSNRLTRLMVELALLYSVTCNSQQKYFYLREIYLKNHMGMQVGETVDGKFFPFGR
jgi:hypothetical protein